nr:hypothetical protein [Tanacetum cinerariifolium]
MPFGLNNAGATYQGLVDKVSSKQIRRNLKAYVDDMVIKSTFEEGMLSDIQETFKRFWWINMKLNPKNKKALKILLSSHDNGSHSEKRVKEKKVLDPSNEWKLYTNGASSSDGKGAGLMLIDPAGKEYTYALRFEFETTNNEAEYDALLAGLRIAQEMEITKVAIFLDSQLVVLVEVLAKRSIEEKEVLKVEIEEKRSWMSPIQEYLLSGLLLEDTKEARKIRIQTDKIIKEIHEGSCGFNTKPCSMVVRITKQGYYWPSMHREAAKKIQDCDKCKEQSAIRKAGMDGTIAVESTWPFSHWGIHILGLLPMAPRGLQFLAIAVEHSTKLVEAKPITIKNVRQVEKFAWEYVVCRFEVPRMISSKEEKHFKKGIFADFYKGLNIMQRFSPIMEHMEIMHRNS